MNDVAVPPPQIQSDLCARCLQPVSRKARRCPACSQPLHNRRYVPLLIGVAGLLALAFAMALMYYAAWRTDLQNSRVPVDEGAPPAVMVETPPDTGKPAEPPKPEKRPPLDEK